MQESNYDKYVMGQTLGKLSVISVHQWLEHLLALSLRAVIPDPDALFRDRTLSFALLVSLCEAHRIIEAPLAEALRKVNAFRNKCAHQLSFEPDWRSLRVSIDAALPAPAGAGDDDDIEALRRLAEHLEAKTTALGALPGGP